MWTLVGLTKLILFQSKVNYFYIHMTFIVKVLGGALTNVALVKITV